MALIDLTGVSKFIDDLSNTDPEESDFANQLGAWVRGIQNVLLNTFPNVTAAVTATAAELNRMDGQDQDLKTTDDVDFNSVDVDSVNWSRIASADSPYSASVGENIFCTCDGAITINMPAGPSSGDRVRVRVDHQCDGTNYVQIDPDGTKKVANETTVEIDLAFFESEFIANASENWEM